MKHLILLFLIVLAVGLQAQELNFTVKVNTQKLQTVDARVFETLENTLVDFLNNQKWTEDVYEPEERIKCNLVLTVQEERSPTDFKVDLAISASRPVYNSTYETPLFNHLDKEVTFSYQQYEPIQYSQNNYNDNLSAVLSFYVYIVLGMDYDSFSPFGGSQYFQIAQDILNNVPSSAAAANPGWRSIESNRNRYWLIENLLSPKFRPYRQAMYDYHRQSLDIMADDPATARAIMVEALGNIRQANNGTPNSMLVQVFNNAKANEIVEIFKGGSMAEQNQVIQIMSRIDASNASKYREIRGTPGRRGK